MYLILEGTLFVAKNIAFDHCIVVRYDPQDPPDAIEVIDIYRGGSWVYDVDVLGNHLVFVDHRNGIKVVLKNGAGVAEPVYTTGLQCCTHFYSIHVIKGMKY